MIPKTRDVWSPHRTVHDVGRTPAADALSRVRRFVVGLNVERVHGPEVIAYQENELVVVCLVRDGAPYLEPFVEHYSSLGARHIVFLDNYSSDDTASLASAYENVTVLRTTLPYKRYKYAMKQYLMARFGRDRWVLCVDIDELFDYPYSDALRLDSFLDYLNAKSYTAVTAQMLDMFPEEPLSVQAERANEPLKELHRFYDTSGLLRKQMIDHPRLGNSTVGGEELEIFRGGIRNDVFGVMANLTKYPLVFNDGRVRPMEGSSHRVDHARIADVSCVLFHYKFLGRFREQSVQAVREGNYHADSSEYKRYLEVFDEVPDLRLKRESARELRGVDDLVEDDFLIVSDDYVSWVDAEEKHRWSRAEPREVVEALLEARRRERALHLKTQRISRQLRDREREARVLERQTKRLLSQRTRSLQRQLVSIQSSRGWRLLSRLQRAKSRVLRIWRSPS